MLNQCRRVAASTLAALLIGQSPLAQAETRSYQHDNSGNITQCSVTIGNAAPAVTTYTYDALNRLQTESGPNKTQTITYDEDGNRLSDGAGSYTYSTTTNRMLTRLGVTVVTDAAGHVTADGTGRTFTYNGPGQLATVSRNGTLLATYYYDGMGQRSRKVTTASAPQGAQDILYGYDLQGNMLYEIDVTTKTPIRTYFWNPDSNTPIGYVDEKTGKYFYFAVDHLKTPRTVMDDTGKVVWRWESDAFGSTPANEDPDGDGVKVTMNLRFPGQYYDQESGLHYNYHRYYDPAVGRYTQADPIGMRGGINGYAYANGNPLKYVDPTGLAGLVETPVGPLPLPGPSSPGQSKPKDDGSYGGLFPPGTMPTPVDPYGSDVNTEQRVPTLPPIKPPEQGGEQFCQKLLEKCMKGANMCPDPARPAVAGVCLAGYFLCRLGVRGGDHHSGD